MEFKEIKDLRILHYLRAGIQGALNYELYNNSAEQTYLNKYRLEQLDEQLAEINDVILELYWSDEND